METTSPAWRVWLRRLASAILWALVAAGFGYAFIRVFGLERTWNGYTLIAFTPYVAIASFAPLVLALAWRRKAATLVALAATIAFIGVLTPRTLGHPDARRGPVLRVMSANLKLGAADPSTVVRMAVAHQVDVLAIQEFTPHAQAALLGAGLGRLLPYSEQDPAWGPVGSAVFSRFPLTGAGHTALPDTFFQAYATVHVPGAQPIYVRSVHTRAPSTPQAIPAWHRDLTREPPATPRAEVRMLVGDFNSTLDHATLRRLAGTGYHDAASQLGDGLVTTWPYDGRFVPRITLDHILVDPRVGVTSFEARRDPGSDHRAIFATLTLPPA